MKIERIAFDCPSLDELLGGGIEKGTITELFGEAGSGKTNACLVLAKNVVKSGKKVVFIDTEGVSLERLNQICGEEEFHKATQDILFFQPHDFHQQNEAIMKTKSLCENEVGVGLIIVDSMTIFYRVKLGTEASPESRMMLGKQANMLLNIAREFEVPVVITTQVYHDPETNMVHPVGGHFLKHQAKAIIRLEKLPNANRRARIVKHRSIPSGREALFKITEDGFCVCGEDGGGEGEEFED
jgi:DNA repair protein RadB